MNRVLIALALAAGIYLLSFTVGTILYRTGTIATGATHNDCENFAETLAPQYGGDEEDVPQSAIKALAEECLASHELTEWEAYITEYVIWGIWPAWISAAALLVWPFWARILHRQEQAELAADAPRLEPGT